MACLVLMSLFFFPHFFVQFSLPFLIKMYVKIRLGCQCPQAQNSSRAGEGWRGSLAEVLASNLTAVPLLLGQMVMEVPAIVPAFQPAGEGGVAEVKAFLLKLFPRSPHFP